MVFYRVKVRCICYLSGVYKSYQQIRSSIDPSGAMHFSIGDHDPPPMAICCHFQCFCYSFYSLIVTSTSFHAVFPCCILPRSFWFSPSLFSTYGHLHIPFMSDLVSASCNTILFHFFAVHETHSILCRNHIFRVKSEYQISGYIMQSCL